VNFRYRFFFFNGVYVYAAVWTWATTLLNWRSKVIYTDISLHVIVFLPLKLAWRWIFVAAKANAVIFQLA